MFTTTLLLAAISCSQQAPPAVWPGDLPDPSPTPLMESTEEHDARMAWWREARFGLFIHWGLYAIPAGTWQGKRTGGAEWILNTARIHPDDYMPLQKQFNPVDFDAEEWVELAKNAGMRYIVITSKHHDGFCLWPSKFTDFDVSGTPFKRDILGELAKACRSKGMVLCFYHSIMDWTHPDYLPRRKWDDRPTDNADFDSYVAHMRTQVDELIKNYQPAVLWFDGEWEGTWRHAQGQALYDHIRMQAPWVIINNRVDTGRTGMAGLTRAGGYRGDFGTPEQQIPSTGFPAGVDWETCMTMNRSWGWQSFDDNWKSTKDLIRKLVDIASKGGNFLLNIGPMGNGEFPPEAIERLTAIGKWMDVNARSIRGTKASPFPDLAWGRCTCRSLPDGNERLYLHVFGSPQSGELELPGLMNDPVNGKAILLADDDGKSYDVKREEASLVVTLPKEFPDAIDTVLVLDIVGKAIVVGPPTIEPASGSIFLENIEVSMSTPSDDVDIRYTIDGSEPTVDSPMYREEIKFSETKVAKARCFLGDRAVSDTSTAMYQMVLPEESSPHGQLAPGLRHSIWLGNFNEIADFSQRISGNETRPKNSETIVDVVDVSKKPRDENFGMEFSGYITVPKTGLYRFSLDSDDGSQLWIAGKLLIDNDGLHSAKRMEATIALERGEHLFEVSFFEKTGQEELKVEWAFPGEEFTEIPPKAFFH